MLSGKELLKYRDSLEKHLHKLNRDKENIILRELKELELEEDKKRRGVSNG